MNVALPAIVVALTGSLILVFTYLGLYVQERQKYLAVWLLSWTLYAVRFIPEMLIALHGDQEMLAVLDQAVVLCSALLLLWGTYLFLQKKANTVWVLLVVGGSLWIGAGMSSRFASSPAIGSVFLVSAFANVATGIALMRFRETRGPVRLITAWAFILWGLHKVDLPLVRHYPWMVPYGYVCGAALAFVASTGMILLYLDRTKNRLEASERKYRSIFENAAEGIFQTTRDGRFLRVNPALARICGYESPRQLMEAVTDLGTQVYVNSGDRERFLDLILVKGHVQGFETKIYGKGHDICWISMNGRIVRDTGTGMDFYEGSVEDITERKRSEQELHVSRLHLSEAANLAKIAYWEQDERSDQFIFNDAFYALYATDAGREGGYRMEREEYLKRFVHPDDLEELERKIEANRIRVRTANPEEYEYRVIRRDGRVIHILSRNRAILDEEGKVVKIVGVNQDITERKAAEEALRATAARLVRAAKVSRTGNWELDLSTQTIHASPGACRIYGLKGSEWPLAHVQESPLPEYREMLAHALRALIEEGAPYDIEFKIRRADNGDIVDVHSVAEFDPQKKTVFGVIQEVTEKKKLEEQLRQAQKMEAIGTLAGGVAHDFNNILSVILGFANLMQISLPLDDRLTPYVDQIVASANKAADLTQSLLAFSRKQRITLEPRNINDVLRNSTKLLKRLLPEDIEVSLQLAAADAIVRLDLNQIDQVLMNLATNARDAMPGGGRLSISTGLVTLDEEFEKAKGFGKAGTYVLLAISDTGIGMDENTKEHIFDPFFMTKTVDKGTGLGLASVYGIVTQHEGYITVSSKVGEGTTFHIYLPLADGALPLQAPVVTEVKGGGNETILIVEDDSDVRKMMRRILEGAGYVTLEAANGEEAVLVHSEHKDEVDLVILDVVMPGKNGKEVLEEITNQGSRARVIFVSGYTRDIILDKGVQSDKVDFLAKPLNVPRLLSKVRAVLDR